MTTSVSDPRPGWDDPRIPREPLGNDGLTDEERAWFLERFLSGVGNKQPEASGVMTPVPNKPKTPTRTFRVPEDVYRAAQERAAEKGVTVTHVVVRALKRYGKAK